MAIPFTVDIICFLWGEPDFREQDSGTIVDRRKTLNLHKELEAPVQSKKGKKRGATKRTLAKKLLELLLSMGRPVGRPGGNSVASPKDTGGAIAFLTTLTQEEVVNLMLLVVPLASLRTQVAHWHSMKRN